MHKVLVTVGTQLPFDRLIALVDDIASELDLDVFAQTGPASREFSNIHCESFLSPSELNDRLSWCDVVVAHAGMGTILSALVAGKPIVIVPRLLSLGEHRNDHQIATVSRFSGVSGVFTATDAPTLYKSISLALSTKEVNRLSSYAPESTISSIRSLIDG